MKKVKCFGCGELGHTRNKCTNKVLPTENIARCFNETNYDAPFCNGTFNGSHVSTILRDTGCTCVVVSSELLPNLNASKYPKCVLTDYLGRGDEFPVVRGYLDCKWFQGWVQAVVAPIKFCSVLLGNISGAGYPTGSSSSNSLDNDCLSVDTDNYQSQENSVPINAVTRLQAKAGKNSSHPYFSPSIDLDMSNNKFESLQKACSTLKEVREHALDGKELHKFNTSYMFKEINGLLYKIIINSNSEQEQGKKLLVVPKECRLHILKLSHDLPVSGHFSYRKTEQKIKDMYFWPGMSRDIKAYCRSCDICQCSSAKGKAKAPMITMPIFSVPFERVAIDLIGPVVPCSEEGHKYILTLIDYASSFPEAMPLKTITSASVAEALISIFSRVGIPKEILSDRRTQFTSELMSDVYDMVGIKPLFTTPYHPMCNGKIERQHAILKSILKKLCSLKPKTWHKFIPCALFAMRECPSDSTGFSPFEMLYGRQARGPLHILNELWTKPKINNDVQTAYTFLLDLRDKLEETAEIASKYKEISAKQYKTYFDLKSSQRKFKVGDDVLLLLPVNKINC